ncbi:type II secretion system major pseudopilin GspG [Akkermansiaceae bacterium]|nr:type II secretion system major pseudopilin GspG [Akkermansiaceae bacterium]MDB4419311.1 type II secretion system major pseudopilin GspG [bacterium]MDB4435916.1 type II secretion system major pseudopilin GspG [Akkermansiaceae bacterium]MDB4500562.1 type II secretion system major pseudopilin GspG [Akkermansiaceae bacterium]MDB4507978.1 type II secretion system major pseudopilin GspG [Akkermansiaceae bacterium]
MKIQSAPNNRNLRGMARGFSLFEMVIVMGIIGVILGGVIYSSRSFGETARVQRTRADFTSLISHLDSYKMLGSRGYPNQTQGLEALVSKPSTSPVPKDWTQSLRELPVDGWGNAFQYKMPGTKIPNEPELISAGVDGIFGSDDDMSSQD